MTDAREALDAFVDRNATQCGPCDYGLPMPCSCVDARPAVGRLASVIHAALADCDAVIAEMNKYRETHNPDCECEVIEASIETAERIRTAIQTALGDTTP